MKNKNSLFIGLATAFIAIILTSVAWYCNFRSYQAKMQDYIYDQVYEAYYNGFNDCSEDTYDRVYDAFMEGYNFNK